MQKAIESIPKQNFLCSGRRVQNVLPFARLLSTPFFCLFLQYRADFGNQWGPVYYGGQVYDGYGYGMPPHYDPSMYAAATAYAAYPVYGSHQQQVN